MSDTSGTDRYPSWMSEQTRESFETLRGLYLLKLRIRFVKNARNHMVAEGIDG